MIIGPIILNHKFIQRCFINSGFFFNTTKNSIHHLQCSFGDNSKHGIVASSLTRPELMQFLFTWHITGKKCHFTSKMLTY